MLFARELTVTSFYCFCSNAITQNELDPNNFLYTLYVASMYTSLSVCYLSVAFLFMSFMTEEEKEGDVVKFLPLYNDVSTASPKEKTPVLTSSATADTVTFSVSEILKRHSVANLLRFTL